MRRLLVLVGILIVVVAGVVILTDANNTPTAEARGCNVQLDMDPIEPYAIGTWVQLHVTSTCPNVKIHIKNTWTGREWDKAESTSFETWETWKTEETESGQIEVCGLSHDGSGWGNAQRACRTVYVEGGQAPPPGSEPGDNVKCWINAFTITPGSGPVGHTFNFAGQGQCDGNARAARFTIDGNPYGENGSYQAQATWNSDGQSTGNHQICFQVTAGDWGDDAANSCKSLTLTAVGTPPSHDTIQGDQTDNGQPGQTGDSNPSMVDHPGGDPPAANSSSSNPGGVAVCQSYRGNISAGTQLVVDVDYDAYLNVRTNPGTGNQTRDQLHRGDVVTAIGNPVCNGGLYWIEVGYNGKSGWVAISASDGQYIIRNGQTMTSQAAPSSSNSPSGSSGSSSGSGSNDSIPEDNAWASTRTQTVPEDNAWASTRTQTDTIPEDNAWASTRTTTPVSEEPTIRLRSASPRFIGDEILVDYEVSLTYEQVSSNQYRLRTVTMTVDASPGLTLCIITGRIRIIDSSGREKIWGITQFVDAPQIIKPGADNARIDVEPMMTDSRISVIADITTACSPWDYVTEAAYHEDEFNLDNIQNTIDSHGAAWDGESTNLVIP